MYYYQYDTNKKYIGFTPARINPVRPDKYLGAPLGATLVEPSEDIKNFVVPGYYEDGLWAERPDPVPTEEELAAAAAEAFLAAKISKQLGYKNECTTIIVTQYPEAKQRSATMGIYGQTYLDTMTDFIADCIEEENRLYDLVEAATSDEELNAITAAWPEA